MKESFANYLALVLNSMIWGNPHEERIVKVKKYNYQQHKKFKKMKKKKRHQREARRAERARRKKWERREKIVIKDDEIREVEKSTQGGCKKWIKKIGKN